MRKGQLKVVLSQQRFLSLSWRGHSSGDHMPGAEGMGVYSAEHITVYPAKVQDSGKVGIDSGELVEDNFARALVSIYMHAVRKLTSTNSWQEERHHLLGGSMH